MQYEYTFPGLSRITDRLGRQTVMGRDIAGRVSSVTNTLGNAVSFAYGLNDELSQILVDMGDHTNTTTFNYTSANGFTRLTSRVMPSGRTSNVYLRQERLFRKLYDAVRKMKDEDIDFSMKTVLPKKDSQSRLMYFPSRIIVSSWQWFRATFSLTLILFHGAIVVAIYVVARVSLK